MQHVHHDKTKLPEVFQNYFKTNETFHNYETRQHKNYKIHKTNKKWGDKMIRNKGDRLWNALPSSLKNIKNPFKFGKILKKRIIDGY